MKKITLLIGLIVMLLIIVAGYRGGTQMVFQGLKYSIKTFILVLPLLLLAFLAAGFLEVAVPPDLIRGWVGESSGIRGYLISFLTGALLPGAPYLTFPVAAISAENRAFSEVRDLGTA